MRNLDDRSDWLVRRGEGLVETESSGEMMALHVASGVIYAFNPTAYRIWRLIEAPARVSRLCAMLGREFDVEPARCETEVRALLEDLASDGLIDLQPGD
jgi:hypothetical protein